VYKIKRLRCEYCGKNMLLDEEECKDDWYIWKGKIECDECYFKRVGQPDFIDMIDAEKA